MVPVYRIAVLGALLLVACKQDAPGDTADTAEGTLRGALSFGFPLEDRDAMDPPVIGFDHDPDVYEGIYRAYCTDYMGRGFPHCYDEHDGSDFMLDGGFDAMDAGSTVIVAALAGTVEDTDDGNYDRCHSDMGTQDVDCDGHPMQANYVILEHEGGYRTLYWHMKTDSVAVQPGQQVERGAALGLVGSSGYSSAPHLHFELQGPDGEAIDPYAGEHSQPETWWCEQGDHDDFPGDCD
jgi:murein DD-endopeptidase MepM/ murein hydrolase activator NlpD